MQKGLNFAMDVNYYKQYEPVFGAWKISRLIGEGSYGKVFEIAREDFGVTYQAALKAITIPKSESELQSAMSEGMDEESVSTYFRGFVEDLTREIALMDKMKGSSYVVNYDDHVVIKHEDAIGWDILIRMELLTPLNRYLQTHMMTEEEVLRLGIDLCKALELCAQHHIIHRDIKPENIFFSNVGTFKLGDFGIARIAEKTTGASTRIGTGSYMAPEVFRGENYTASVDIYSLGLVLYRLMNQGRLPFLPLPPDPITHTLREQAQAQRMTGVPLPAPVQASAAFAQVILKAAAFKKEDRYATASDLRKALEALLKGEDAGAEDEAGGASAYAYGQPIPYTQPQSGMDALQSDAASSQPAAAPSQAFLEEERTQSVFSVPKQTQPAEQKKKRLSGGKIAALVAAGTVAVLAIVVIVYFAFFHVAGSAGTDASSDRTTRERASSGKKTDDDAVSEEEDAEEEDGPTAAELYQEGLNYYYGHTVEEDRDKAYAAFSEAALMFPYAHPGACYYLAMMNMEDGEMESQPEVVADIFQRAARRGHPEALVELGYCYTFGQGVEENADAARVLYCLAAINGSEAGADVIRMELDALPDASTDGAMEIDVSDYGTVEVVPLFYSFNLMNGPGAGYDTLAEVSWEVDPNQEETIEVYSVALDAEDQIWYRIPLHDENGEILLVGYLLGDRCACLVNGSKTTPEAVRQMVKAASAYTNSNDGILHVGGMGSIFYASLNAENVVAYDDLNTGSMPNAAGQILQRGVLYQIREIAVRKADEQYFFQLEREDGATYYVEADTCTWLWDLFQLDHPFGVEPMKDVAVRHSPNLQLNGFGTARKGVRYPVLGQITDADGSLWYKIDFDEGETAVDAYLPAEAVREVE